MQTFYEKVYNVAVWLGRVMGKAMKRMGFD